MKNILSGMGLAIASLLTLGSCTSYDDPTPNDNSADAYREVTVNVAPLSRTTIEYENSDFSHLVWQDGDRVAYVTDLAGDTFRTAAISHNSFTATLPAAATSSNRIIVVYPAGDLQGKSLPQASLAIGNPADMNVDTPFDGTRLPMTAVMNVPETADITADFEVLPAVIRLTINPNTHGEEVLKSVTLSANEPLCGTYVLKNGALAFEGSDKSITMNIASDSPSMTELFDGKRYVYFVVPRASFTGLCLTVATDAATYSFADGKIDLTDATRSLYRLAVALGEPDPAKEPMYTKITSTDLISGSSDDRYLIVCEGKSSLLGEFNSGNYHYPLPVTIANGGIDPNCAEAVKCQLSITHPEGVFASRYILYSHNIRDGRPYIGCMSNFSGTPGKFAFRASLSSGTSLECWDIAFDADGNALIMAHPNTQDVQGDVFLGFSKPKDTFCLYGADANTSDFLPLQIYKLIK